VLVPIGILSLISAKLGESGEFWTIMEHLLFFSLTVITGLAVHLFIFLPALYYAIVRKNPYKVR
jgi:Na+/H+-dicarboxylate symporter